MNYYELLNWMIEESNLTHKEIAEKCIELGVKINPSYISKLRTCKQPPASDEVNNALSEACGFKEYSTDLLFQSFLEKAPEYIADFIKELISLFRSMAKFSLKDFPESLIPLMEEQLNSMSDYQLINTSIEQMKNGITQDNIKKLSNSVETKMNFKMEDDSMFPLIPKGAILLIENDKEVCTGDIIIIKLDTDQYIVRRYIEYINNSIILLSESNKEDNIQVEKENVEIVGRVKSFTISLG